jgi:hypothetical protein
MKDLCDIQPGEQVILTTLSGRHEVRVVRSHVQGLIDIGQGKADYNFRANTGKAVRGSALIEVATPELIRVVRREHQARDQAAKREKASRDADPRTLFVQRFKTGDFEPWEKLTLEQLQQIAAWLDA